MAAATVMSKAPTKDAIEGLYKNHAVNNNATYEMNIERLKNSPGLLTMSSFLPPRSLATQCGPSIK
jgi:hypothetical protein